MEEFYAYVKATIYKLIGFTCIVAAVLFAGGWWLVYRQRLEHRLFLHAQQPFGTSLKIAAPAGGVIHPRRCRVPAGLHLPGRHRHPAVPVHLPGGCRGRYLFVPRPRLCRCIDCTSQTVKERRYCVWNYMQGIIWSFSSWV